jgi:hypothetical protein
VKQDKALYNREEVPEVRTESPRKSNSQHPKNWRLKELMLMLMLLLLQVGVVMKKEIMDAVMLNTEYEAGVKVHQGRKLNRYEKPETMEVMLKTNPEGKYDEVTVVRKKGSVRQEQVEQLLKVLGYKLIGDEQDLHLGAREDRFNGDTGRHDDDYDVIKVEKLSRQSVRTPMGEPVIKSLVMLLSRTFSTGIREKTRFMRSLRRGL